MAKVEGVSAIQKALQKASERFVSPQAAEGESVIVGYTANYALHVHENIDADHDSPGRTGQAKFLEQPAREKGPEIAERIVAAVAGGARLQDALVVGGMFLQGESQNLCPVLTGNLKGSAFTRKE
jgi:hypothetical protein